MNTRSQYNRPSITDHVYTMESLSQGACVALTEGP